MISDFTTSSAARERGELGLHSGRVQEAYSSKHLAVRPRVPMGVSPRDFAPPTAEQIAKREENSLQASITLLEQQIVEALFSRTTAQTGEHRILKSAFTKFDADMSGAVSYKEFKKTLEYLGLHTMESGLPGQGGYPEAVVEGLFRSYDKDGSGELDYHEFAAALLKDNDVGLLG